MPQCKVISSLSNKDIIDDSYSCHIDHAKAWETQITYCCIFYPALSLLLTLIIALEVMRKRVARSFTALIFSPPSTGTFRPSSSLRERCRAAPCLAIRSLHVLRSSSLLTRILSVPWISLRSDWDVGSSSPESSERPEVRGQKTNYVLYIYILYVSHFKWFNVKNPFSCFICCNNDNSRWSDFIDVFLWKHPQNTDDLNTTAPKLTKCIIMYV